MFRLAMGLSWLLAACLYLGCDQQLPRPPAKEFSNSAEADFDWVLERLKHAIEMLDPPSSLGIRVERELDYKLLPPKKPESNYKALVTVTTKTIYSHLEPQSSRNKRNEREKQEEKDAAEREGSRDPFALPGEEPITGTTTIDDALELGKSEQKKTTVVDPEIPRQELKISEEINLEYVEGEWKQLNRAGEEHIQLWFDYALQQGEYDPTPESLDE